jgi:hypothetical protein
VRVERSPNCVYYAWAMHLGKHLHGKEFWARQASRVKAPGRGNEFRQASQKLIQVVCTIRFTPQTRPNYLYPIFFAED